MTGEELVALRGHGANVNWVAFDRSGALLLTASEDGTAKVWKSVPLR